MELRNSHEDTTGISTESAINLGVESEFQESQNRLRVKSPRLLK